eukprot:scaffold19656_cov69-Cyclotella_meneghiniana.AAC.2
MDPHNRVRVESILEFAEVYGAVDAWMISATLMSRMQMMASREMANGLDPQQDFRRIWGNHEDDAGE